MAAPYTAQGTLLMGTLRWQKELAEAETRANLSAEFERQHSAVNEELAELDGRVQALQRNIAAKRSAQNSLEEADRRRHQADESRYWEMVELRKTGELGSERPAPDADSKQPPASALPFPG